MPDPEQGPLPTRGPGGGLMKHKGGGTVGLPLVALPVYGCVNAGGGA